MGHRGSLAGSFFFFPTLLFSRKKQSSSLETSLPYSNLQSEREPPNLVLSDWVGEKATKIGSCPVLSQDLSDLNARKHNRGCNGPSGRWRCVWLRREASLQKRAAGLSQTRLLLQPTSWYFPGVCYRGITCPRWGHCWSTGTRSLPAFWSEPCRSHKRKWHPAAIYRQVLGSSCNSSHLTLITAQWRKVLLLSVFYRWATQPN